jgi:hypothetical protein
MAKALFLVNSASRSRTDSRQMRLATARRAELGHPTSSLTFSSVSGETSRALMQERRNIALNYCD